LPASFLSRLFLRKPSFSRLLIPVKQQAGFLTECFLPVSSLYVWPSQLYNDVADVSFSRLLKKRLTPNSQWNGKISKPLKDEQKKGLFY
jgi:hypothetical protein